MVSFVPLSPSLERGFARNRGPSEEIVQKKRGKEAEEVFLYS